MMNKSTFRLALAIGLTCSYGLVLSQVADQTRNIPVPPKVAQKRSEASALTERGARLVKEGKFESAVSVLEQASIKEDEAFGHCSDAKYQLAKLYVQLHRNERALDAYRRAFNWNPYLGDLTVNGPDPIYITMDYAILLAKQGKQEEAKAIYYYGLRCLNSTIHPNRFVEPVPFLVVFDAEEDGCTWTYSAEKLEAVATMTKIMRGARDADLARVKELVPEWFYPTMWRASRAWRSPRGAQLLAQAKSLAASPLEKELVKKYEEDLAAHRERIKATETPFAEDESLITEGNLRRRKMRCLKPNLEILKQISVQR